MRPIGGNITDYAASATKAAAVVATPYCTPRGTRRGLRGSVVGWVMSGNAANEVYEDT